MGVELRELVDALVLEPELGGRIHATVMPPTGLSHDPEASSGAKIWVSGSIRVARRGLTSSVDGVFVVDALPAAVDYVVTASAKPYPRTQRRGVEVRPGETTELELRFGLGVEISGRVVGANAEGVADAIVILLSTALQNGSRRTERSAVQADARGEFRLRGVPAGAIRIEIVHSDFLPAQEDLGVLENGAVSSGLVLALDPGRFIAGLVQWRWSPRMES